MKHTHEQTLQALKDSVKHYDSIVTTLEGAKVGGSRIDLPLGAGNCPLCTLHNGGGGCNGCPLGDCREGSLYKDVSNATTNPEAYTASKAMLAELQRLLKEEEGRKPEHDIRVGDVVIHKAFTAIASSWTKDCPHAQINCVGIVTSIKDCYVVIARNTTETQRDHMERYTLIHRPTK